MGVETGDGETMNRIALGWAVGAFVAASVAFGQQEPAPAETPAAPSAEPFRVIEQPIPIGAAHKTKLTLEIGELAVLGEDIDHIVVRTLIFCEKAKRDLSRCDSDARDLSLAVVTDGDRLSVDVKGVTTAVSRRIRVRQEVRVPAQLPIEVVVRSGDVRVDGMRGDVKVNVKEGSANLHLPSGDVHEVKLEAGGQIELVVGGQTIRGNKSLLGNKLSWETTTGTSRVRADVSIGSLWVTLN
jgi:hypothetical protein